MRFLSVCSGIEAASVAWNPLGWKAVAFSEIEPFPCAVLAHHYPDTPNWGDMTKYKEWPDVAIDLLCGGTPCQSFSVAGLRKGLDDPRGNLMLTFGAIAAKYRPKWLVWENVPGVLSSNAGQDFASFLGLLTGQVVKVPAGGWSNSGIVSGIPEAYGLAYRVLDAQYFGVPQRRRRVFVVGCLGDWRSAAAVLFERHGLSGDPAPSRKARQSVAPTLSARTKGGGGLGTDFDCDGGLVPQAVGFVQNQRDEVRLMSVAGALAAEPGAKQQTYVATPAIAFDSRQDPVSSEFLFGALGSSSPQAQAVTTLAIRGRGDSHQLETRSDGTANALLTPNGGRGGIGVGAIHYGMQVRRLTPEECEALQAYPRGYTRIPGWNGWRAMDANETPESCRAAGLDVRQNKKTLKWRVRDVDGPRYKALGNSWCTTNARWIGERIDRVNSILEAA